MLHSIVKRKGKHGERDGIDVSSPPCISDYNSFMGGVTKSRPLATVAANVGHAQQVNEELCKIRHQWQHLTLRGQFLHACSPDLAVFIKEHMPCDLEKMVEWAEVFVFSRSDTSKKEVNRKPSQVAGQSPNPQPIPAQRRFQGSNRPSSSSVRCFICKEIGHMAYQCQTGRSGPPTQQQHRPLSGNAGVCIDLDQDQCSYHNGKAFLACGCGLPVVGSTGLDSHTNLPLLSG